MTVDEIAEADFILAEMEQEEAELAALTAKTVALWMEGMARSLGARGGR